MLTGNRIMNRRIVAMVAAMATVSLVALGGCHDYDKKKSGRGPIAKSDAGATAATKDAGATGTAAKKTATAASGESSAKASAAAVAAALSSGGHSFAFELRDGAPAGGVDKVKAGKAKPLTDEITKALLKRLPAIGAKKGDVKEFALREGVKPPPLKGDTVKGEFPPKAPAEAAKDTAKDKKLEVLRIQPEGDLPLVPRISVTFNQPMVAVTSHEELKKVPVPVKLNPQPKGEWRWIGTKTVAFQPEGRAPMATNYTITVPKGIKSASGQTLDAEKVVTFTTPPVKVVNSGPHGDSTGVTPLMYATFNQKIDAKKVFATIKMVDADGTNVPIELLGVERYRQLQAEAAKVKLETIGQPVREDWKDRWVGFRPTQELDTDERYTITIGPGTPSEEGPRTTDSAHNWSFKTYGPFEFKRKRCGWGSVCRPNMSWRVEFTNRVDPEKFKNALVKVSPEVKGFKAIPSWRNLSMRGAFKGRTKYTVTISGDLTDEFGQKLGNAKTVSFDVGPADKMLSAQNETMMILDPGGKPKFPVYVTNYKKLRLRAYRVSPTDWRDYLEYRRNQWREKNPPSPPGKKVFDKLVDTEAPPDEVHEVNLDLLPMLEEGGTGQLVFIVTPRKSETKDKWALRRHTIATWVQATKIGVDAIMDHDEMIVLATSLKDGSRLEGVKVTLSPGGASLEASTDASGVARIKLPASAKQPQYLAASKGKDLAFMPDSYSYWSSSGRWYLRSESDRTRWFVFDDRKLYKPNETVRLKGWVRQITKGPKGDVRSLAGKLEKVSYRVVGSRGNELAKGEVPVNAAAGFHLSFKLPKTPNLGQARVELRGQGGPYASYTHRFDIQEFRRPEFEVSASSSQGPHIIGGDATMSVFARYYSGGPLPNAEVNWRVTAKAGSYRPPNQQGYTFGYWTPWWESRSSYRGRSQTGSQQFKATTDGAGKHHLELAFKSVSPAKPTTVNASVSVMDVNRQAWSSSTSMLVHPSSLYVGLKTTRTFVEAGQPIKVDAVVSDIDGKRVADTKIEMRMVRLEWNYTKGKWTKQELDPQTCDKASTSEAVQCEFMPKKGGRHRIYAKVVDSKKRANESRLTVWVPGGDAKQVKNVELEKLQFIPTKKEYQPGDTAEILVQAPFAPAEGIMTISRGEIVEVRNLTFKKPAQIVKVKIEEWQIPNINLNGFAVGAAPRVGANGEPDPKLPSRPAVAAGGVRLSVPPHVRTLKVTATPEKQKLEPGGKTALTVEVKDHAGRPVKGAELAVVVVDESVLALTGYKLPDPVSTFYTGRYSHIRKEHLRTKIRLASLDDLLQAGAEGEALEEESMAADSAVRPQATAAAPAALGAASGGAPGAPRKAAKRRRGKSDSKKKAEAPPAEAPASTETGAIKVRKNFSALALFAPEVPTDDSGKATVEVKLPDNLTRYRVMVAAVADERRFGQGESHITARMPVQVRMSAPRFLNFGDTFELPVVVQNQTDNPLEVDVAVRSTNAAFTKGQGQRVAVPPNDRVEVRFATATHKPGTARFQVGVQTGKFADASEVKLPVWTPATTEAFATYGVVDDGAIKQPVKTPGKVVKEYGGVQVQTSSTQLQALTDAVAYIYSYPFECSEQLSSRVMALSALKDVLSAFDAPGLPAPEKMLKAVARDFRRLQGMQNSDGGFGFWRRGPRSWPFLTVHVTHAMVRAKAKGFSVSTSMMNRAMRYLKTIEGRFPSYYSESTRRAIRSYALYVRALTGDKDPKEARQIMAAEGGAEKAGFDIIGWLYPVFTGESGYDDELGAIRKHLNNRVTEEAGTAHFATSYNDGAHLILHSSRRADGILLEGLIGDQPKSDLIPKIVRGLLAHRKKGRWGSTQENVWVLIGLDKYFNTYEKVTPNFVARVWLGDGFAGEHAFKGRTTERHQVDIPMAWLAGQGGEGTKDLIIGKKGKGRMYYRVGMTYAPADLKLDPMDRGFTVEREYRAIDNPDDVKRDKDGTWRIKAGAKVRVRVTMVAPTRRYHVALVDPLPAGLEALNPALRGTEKVDGEQFDVGRRSKGAKKKRAMRRPFRYNYWGRWYEHDNLRDERAEAFRSLLYGGVYTYAYVARATTPGTFVVPPAKAEQMYAPEVFGRSASDVVVVQ